MRRITAWYLAQSFTTHLVFDYGAPASFLIDNSRQITSKFVLLVFHILDIKNVFTPTYHSQVNGKVLYAPV